VLHENLGVSHAIASFERDLPSGSLISPHCDRSRGHSRRRIRTRVFAFDSAHIPASFRDMFRYVSSPDPLAL
jgi:hypothetical protein